MLFGLMGTFGQMAFVRTRVFRVTVAYSRCWPSPMSFPGDFVSRFNPQILDLNRSAHWPLTSRPDWGLRKGPLCNQKTGVRMMNRGAPVFCCPEFFRNWPKDSQHWSSVTLSYLSFQTHRQTPKAHWQQTHNVWVSFIYDPCDIWIVLKPIMNS